MSVSTFIDEQLQGLNDRVQSLETVTNRVSYILASRSSSRLTSTSRLHLLPLHSKGFISMQTQIVVVQLRQATPEHASGSLSKIKAIILDESHYLRLWSRMQPWVALEPTKPHLWPLLRSPFWVRWVRLLMLDALLFYLNVYADVRTDKIGASLAWSAVFTGARGNLVLLAWASSTFIASSVAAGSMGIILESDKIDFDRDMGVQRAIRAFAITAAVMKFVGIILLGIATAGVNPSSTGVGNMAGSQRGMQAAGWSIVVVVVIEVLVALTVRIMYHSGPWKFWCHVLSVW